MEVAKRQLKQSYVLVPVFFSISGGLTLIAAGGAYTKHNLHYVAKPCFITGLIMVVFSIIYSLAMTFVVPYFKQLYQLETAQKHQAEMSLEDGLGTYSEEVLAADGEGIAFGPKRRRRTSKDTLSELWTKEKRDGHRESSSQAVLRGSFNLPSQQGRKDSIPRKSSRSSKQSSAGQSMDIGEQNESINPETTANFDTSTENIQPTEERPKYTERITSSNTEGI